MNIRSALHSSLHAFFSKSYGAWKADSQLSSERHKGVQKDTIGGHIIRKSIMARTMDGYEGYPYALPQGNM
jgi:hypothetical protein